MNPENDENLLSNSLKNDHENPQDIHKGAENVQAVAKAKANEAPFV